MPDKKTGDPAVGAALVAARKRHRLTAVAMAKRLGYGSSWLGNIERGERNINATELKEFAAALGESTDEVLGIAEETPLGRRLSAYSLDEIHEEELVRIAAVMAGMQAEPIYDRRRAPDRAPRIPREERVLQQEPIPQRTRQRQGERSSG